MTSPDYFALLEQPRRLWFDSDALKQKFLSVSAAIHPDRVHNADESVRRTAKDRYAELAAAHKTLTDPRDRLRHFIELETGRKPEDLQEVPPDLANFFFEIARICRAADAIVGEKTNAASALAKAQLFERSQEIAETLGAAQRRISDQREELLGELKAADAQWLQYASHETSKRQELLVRLEQLYQLFSYFDRWSQQLQERLVQLAF